MRIYAASNGHFKTLLLISGTSGRLPRLCGYTFSFAGACASCIALDP
jgi:hypothetical protein